MSILKPSRELDLGKNISFTFNLYFKNFQLFFLPFLASVFVSLVPSLFIILFIRLPPLSPSSSPQESINWFITMIPILILSGLISWITYTIATGMIIKSASEIIEKGSANARWYVNLRDSFSFTARIFPALLIGGLITGVLIVLGATAFIVPGVILFVMFSLYQPAIIIEHLGVLNSLSRSRKLVSKRWLTTFTFFLIIGIIGSAALLIVNLLFMSNFLLPSILINTNPSLLNIDPAISNLISIVNSVLFALVYPIFPLAETVYYYSMLAREQSHEQIQMLQDVKSVIKIKCLNCGALNDEDSIFCVNCGKKLTPNDN